MSEYYGAPTTPMDDYLAHYGVKGMKWGVRRAIASGNDRRLSRQYAKAEKKLAKLEKRAANSEKYAKRAKRLGAGAAVAGGLAVAGTEGIAKGMKGVAAGVDAVGKFASRHGIKVQGTTNKARHGLRAGANAVEAWGKQTGTLGKAYDAAKAAGLATPLKKASDVARSVTGTGLRKNLSGISNNALARVGAAAVGAGLAAGAAKNAYRAATAKKKAAQFRSEINKAFAGTKYANGGSSTSGKKRRRSNRG